MGTESRLYDVSCLVHVHSTYSDGSATIPELLDDARRAGADALLLTDHDSRGARDAGWEGAHDGVFSSSVSR
jgi:predicted metal-dependent phosphoesterase TrpH